MIEPVVQLVQSGQDLTMDRMSETMGLIMQGRCEEKEIARLLVALHEKGEAVSEIAGAAAAMRREMTPIRSTRTGLIDTCGTGGDASGTFNISTAAALVTAAAGVPVAKHGNRGITSRSGSADALAALGVHVEADVAQVEACLDELGICFCFAPLLHKAMKHVGPVRKKLAHPTIFNMLGPLVNPAGAAFQLLGVGRPELRPKLAQALVMLKTERTLVVHGEDGLDEVTLGGTTHVTEAKADGLREFEWTPADFGLEPAGRESMLVDGPEQSAELIREIFSGKPGPPRDVVVINAAAALWTVGLEESPASAAQRAADAIDGGKARDLLSRLAERSWAK